MWPSARAPKWPTTWSNSGTIRCFHFQLLTSNCLPSSDTNLALERERQEQEQRLVQVIDEYTKCKEVCLQGSLPLVFSSSDFGAGVCVQELSMIKKHNQHLSAKQDEGQQNLVSTIDPSQCGLNLGGACLQEKQDEEIKKSADKLKQMAEKVFNLLNQLQKQEEWKAAALEEQKAQNTHIIELTAALDSTTKKLELAIKQKEKVRLLPPGMMVLRSPGRFFSCDTARGRDSQLAGLPAKGAARPARAQEQADARGEVRAPARAGTQRKRGSLELLCALLSCAL